MPSVVRALASTASIVASEVIARDQSNPAAERMGSVCLTGRGDCLLVPGRLHDAAAAYEVGIARAEGLGAERDVAVGQGNLGTVRLHPRGLFR
jgi:hypothetical protein